MFYVYTSLVQITLISPEIMRCLRLHLW